MAAPDINDPLRNAMLKAMRRLAKSVSVITCVHEGRRFAMSASAVDSLSADPPSVLICINRSSSIYAPLAQGAAFCVNILAANQQDIAHACAGRLKGEDRFNEGNWSENAAGMPYLTDAQASVMCRQDGQFEYGTHTVFIGRIEEIVVGETVSPLVYVDGTYTTSTPLPPALAACA
ncbi:MAG TPA: flavin reductase family protein [Noviherbaspirillum sp.]|nr:flavin reductase family protein [Noviherbaspirillum sp.]